MRNGRLTSYFFGSARSRDDEEQAGYDPAKDRSRSPGSEWNHPPLCRDYLAVIVATLPVAVRRSGVVRDHLVLWALGTLVDGQHELLGAWREPPADELIWQEVFADLACRGVERIRVIAVNESGGLNSILRDALLHATVLPKDLQLGTIDALSPRHRHSVLASQAAVDQVHRYARRAVARHLCFSDLVDATASVMDALGRGLQKVGTSVPNADGACWSRLAPAADARNISSVTEPLGR